MSHNPNTDLVMVMTIACCKAGLLIYSIHRMYCAVRAWWLCHWWPVLRPQQPAAAPAPAAKGKGTTPPPPAPQAQAYGFGNVPLEVGDSVYWGGRNGNIHGVIDSIEEPWGKPRAKQDPNDLLLCIVKTDRGQMGMAPKLLHKAK